MSEPTFFQAVASTPLLQRAMLAGAFAGTSCAVLSPLVVLRRMAFVGDGMAHAAFGGIGFALFLLPAASFDDLSVQWVTIAFCMVIGALVARASRTGSDKMAEDSAIGIAFSVSMALGALFIALRQKRGAQSVPTIDQFLFGSIMNISRTDVLMIAGIAAAVIAVMFVLRKEMLFYTFDARLAEASGLSVGFFHYLFMMLLVMTVVVSSRVVGIVLVSTSLILPGVIALKLCTRLAPAMILASLVGVISFELGMYASYEFSGQGAQIHPGTTIILIQFVMLMCALVFRALVLRPHAASTVSPAESTPR